MTFGCVFFLIMHLHHFWIQHFFKKLQLFSWNKVPGPLEGDGLCLSSCKDTRHIKLKLKYLFFLCQEIFFYSKWTLDIATHSSPCITNVLIPDEYLINAHTHHECVKSLQLSQNICIIAFTHNYLIIATHWLAPLCLCSCLFIVLNRMPSLCVYRRSTGVCESCFLCMH